MAGPEMKNAEILIGRPDRVGAGQEPPSGDGLAREIARLSKRSNNSTSGCASGRARERRPAFAEHFASQPPEPALASGQVVKISGERVLSSLLPRRLPGADAEISLPGPVRREKREILIRPGIK